MMKKKIPVSANEWLIEIAEAYQDAEEAIPFWAPAAGVDITKMSYFMLRHQYVLSFVALAEAKKH